MLQKVSLSMQNKPKFNIGDPVRLKQHPEVVFTIQQITTYRAGLTSRHEYQTEIGHGIPEEDLDYAEA